MAPFSLRKFWYSLFGDLDKISSEKYFVTLTTIIAAFFLFILCFVHIIIGLRIAPVIIAGSASILMLVLYYFLRFKNCLFIPKVILSGLGLILLDMTWYSKFMSNGPVLFFILIFAALVIWVWEGKSLALVLTFYFLNLAVLGIVEELAPDNLLIYSNPRMRGFDIYFSFFLYSTLLIFLLYIVKKEFERQKQKAEKSDRLKSAFLSNMSHEIRTPLNAIVGFSHLIGTNIESKNKQEYINIIQNSSDNLLRLINDIIDLAKIEAGDMVVIEVDTNIEVLFEEIKKVFKNELAIRKKEHILFDYTLPKEGVYLRSDPLRLKQIISNFISNAIKFTAEGSIIYSCEKKGDKLVFRVRDTGTGIPVADQGKLFDRFTKFDYEGKNTEGSGIGLAISKSLVSLLKGSVWFNSKQGEGSEFCFSIPYVALPPIGGNQKSMKKISVNKKMDSSESNHKSPILIVEDDEASLILIEEILSSLNIEFESVSDGGTAIETIRNKPYISFILMDIRLPTVDGYEAVKAIKKINPNIFVVAQTAFAMQGDRLKALSAGFDEYITKPLDTDKLQDLLRFYSMQIQESGKGM